MNSSKAPIDPTQNQSETSRTNLIAAFNCIIATAGRRQATDLHVRRLLCYVRAKDVDGQGAQRSLRQVADRLVLTVSTCRRVIARAIEHFGLLVVTQQRNCPGGQTANRYSINWENVNALLCDKNSGVAPVNEERPSTSSSQLPSAANSTRHPHMRLPPSTTSSASYSRPLSAASSPTKALATTDQPPIHRASNNFPCSSPLASLRFSSSSAVKLKTRSSPSAPASNRLLNWRAPSRHGYRATSTSLIERLPPEITRIGPPSTNQVSASLPPTEFRAPHTGCSLRSCA